MFCTIVFVNGHSELHYILRLVRHQRSLKVTGSTQLRQLSELPLSIYGHNGPIGLFCRMESPRN